MKFIRLLKAKGPTYSQRFEVVKESTENASLFDEDTSERYYLYDWLLDQPYESDSTMDVLYFNTFEDAKKEADWLNSIDNDEDNDEI